MVATLDAIHEIDEQIKRSDDAICRHIKNLDASGRGAVSQDILSNLRTFVEHTMFKIYAYSNNCNYDYKNIEDAISFVKKKGQLGFLWKFHGYLQIVASHYTLDPENSERVMLKYYEFMLRIKSFLKIEYNFEVLANLDDFPLNTDKTLQEYYEKIAMRLVNRNIVADKQNSKDGRYYIHKIKPFFVNHKIYYEVTFIDALKKSNKSDRIIAFTTLDISKYYAVKLWTVNDNIQILGKTMPVFIIVEWEVAVRPVEIQKFSRIFGENLANHAGSAEVRGLMLFLKNTGFNLVELLCFDDDYYKKIRSKILEKHNAKVSHLFDLFDRCRELIGENKAGSNMLRYLLYRLNDNIIENQLGDSNDILSGLYLKYGCIPFDKMPFNTSPMGHNPRIDDLFDCIDAANRMHELLARYILTNTETRGSLYTPRAELERFGDVDTLVDIYTPPQTSAQALT